MPALGSGEERRAFCSPEIIGVPPYKIGYAHANSRLAEPAHRVMNKRLYTPDDVRRVALHFGVKLDEARLAAAGGKGAE
jgi:hypothetical protein